MREHETPLVVTTPEQPVLAAPVTPAAPATLPAPIVIQLVIPQPATPAEGAPSVESPTTASSQTPAAPASSVVLIVPSVAGEPPSVLAAPTVRVQQGGASTVEGNTGPSGFQNNGVDARQRGTPTVYGDR